MPWAKMPGVEINVELIAIHGDRQEIQDACLLLWKDRQKERKSFDHVMPAVLTYMTKETGPDDYDQWMAKRLETEGWPDEATWFKHMMQSDNVRVAKAAIRGAKESLGDEWQPVVQGLLSGTGTRSETKWDAIEALDKTGTQETLLALVGLLNNDDKRTVTFHPRQFKDPNHPILELIRRSEEYSKLLPKPKPKKVKKPKPSPKTLGELALKKLKSMTHKDFGKDAQAWKDWINTH